MHDLKKSEELEKLLEFHRNKDFIGEEARQCARDAYKSQIGDGHCIDWNDRFYIAVMWDLD